MRHEWTEDGKMFAVEYVGPGIVLDGPTMPHTFPDSGEAPLAREILRLAERVRELEALDGVMSDVLEAPALESGLSDVDVLEAIEALKAVVPVRDELREKIVTASDRIAALKEENSILRAGIPGAKRQFEEAVQLADERQRRAQALEEENANFAIRDAGWRAFGASLEADLGLDPTVYRLSPADEIRTAIRGLEARAQAAEEENFALRSRVIEAEENAEAYRRTAVLAFRQVVRIGEENRRLREALRAVVYRNGSAVFNSYKEDTNLAEFTPELLDFLQE